MLYHYRRYWAPLAALVLAVPLALVVVAPTKPKLSPDELRVLAPAPSFPKTWTDMLGLPPDVDAWLKDHFGLRSAFIHAYALWTQVIMREGNDSVLDTTDGCFSAESTLLARPTRCCKARDSSMRNPRVKETADTLADMRDALAARGTRLVVASPPNTASIYDDYLPRWARSNGQVTEQDILLSGLADRGVKTVDLRPVLRAERARGKIYLAHDTHWTARGAVASFNAIAGATSHAEWRFDIASVLGPPVTVTGGDLARMVGISNDVTEPKQFLTLPVGQRETFPEADASSPCDPTYTATLDQPGPTILIIGDSFTVGFFGNLVTQRVGRVIWTTTECAASIGNGLSSFGRTKCGGCQPSDTCCAAPASGQLDFLPRKRGCQRRAVPLHDGPAIVRSGPDAALPDVLMALASE